MWKKGEISYREFIRLSDFSKKEIEKQNKLKTIKKEKEQAKKARQFEKQKKLEMKSTSIVRNRALVNEEKEGGRRYISIKELEEKF